MHKRKISVGSVIGAIVLGGLMVALLIYTATRTVHFLQMTFPPSMGYVAYLALAAFDGGILGWTIFATTAAEGATQRGVSYLMIFVCTLGVILTTIADTTTISAQNGITKLDPYMATVGMWGSIAVIVLNVVAIIVVHLAAPHHVRKFELENVHDSIHQLTMQHIKDRAIEIAPRIAAEHADHWVRQTIQDVVGSLPASKQPQQLPAPSVKVVEAAPSSVAHVKQKVDPHGVKSQVDSEKKSIEKKPGIRDWVDKNVFKAGEDGKRGELVPPRSQTKQLRAEEETIEDDIEEDDPLAGMSAQEQAETLHTVANAMANDPNNPNNWTMADWRKYRNEVDAWTFDAKWKRYNGDLPFPDDRPKKRSGGKKSGNVSRREVLGLESQGENSES